MTIAILMGTNTFSKTNRKKKNRAENKKITKGNLKNLLIYMTVYWDYNLTAN